MKKMANKFDAMELIKSIDASKLKGEIEATFKDGTAQVDVKNCTVQELILFAIAVDLRLLEAFAEAEVPPEHAKEIFDKLPLAAAMVGLDKTMKAMMERI